MKESTTKIIEQIAKEQGISPKDVTNTQVMLYGAEDNKKKPTFLSLAEANIDKRVETSFSNDLKKLGDKKSILIGQNSLRLISDKLKVVVDSQVKKIKNFETLYQKTALIFIKLNRLYNDNNRTEAEEAEYAKIWNSGQVHLATVDQLEKVFHSFTADEQNYLASKGVTEESIRNLANGNVQNSAASSLQNPVSSKKPIPKQPSLLRKTRMGYALNFWKKVTSKRKRFEGNHENNLVIWGVSKIAQLAIGLISRVHFILTIVPEMAFTVISIKDTLKTLQDLTDKVNKIAKRSSPTRSWFKIKTKS